MYKKIVLIFLITTTLICSNYAIEEKKGDMKRLDWFKKAKLGIFIHWGIYAVNGIDESWSFYNNYIPYNDYMEQMKSFTAEKYKPEEWVDYIEKTHANYAVLTTKHHDGVALWETKYSDLNVVKNSPAAQDLVKPFVEALREKNIKVGLYYSLIDWSHKDYPNFTITEKRYEKDDVKWNRFVNFYQNQLEELALEYNPDLWWFDGDWEHDAKEWQAENLKKKLLDWNENVVVNSRLTGYGDYSTPEQGVPIKKPKNKYWELCMTMNDSWGYQHHDLNYKSAYQILRIFVDCLYQGGNLLLDITPKEDGSLPSKQIDILNEIARWNSKHYDAVFNSIEGIDSKYTKYPSTLSEDKNKLYLFLTDRPESNIKISGIKNKVTKITIEGTKQKLKYMHLNNSNHELLIEMNSEFLDDMITVVSIELEGQINLQDELIYKNEITDIIKDNDWYIIEKYVEMLSHGVTSEILDNYVPENKALQSWKEKHFEVLTKPNKGIPEGYFYGETSLSENRDVLFLYLNNVSSEKIVLKGIKNKINRIRVVGTGVKLEHQIYNKLYWSEIPGIIYIKIPRDIFDKNQTVIAVQLDGEIDLFEEK